MPTIRKRDTGYQAIVRLTGFAPESRIFDSKAKASAWAYAREAELRNMRHGIVRATLQEAIDRYIEEVCPGMRSGPNIAKRLRALSKTVGLLPVQRPIDQVSAVDLARFRDLRMAEVSPATVRKEMVIMRSVFESARRDWGMVLINPLADVKKPPAPPARKRLFADSEVQAVVAALGYADDQPVATFSQQTAVALLLALETGMRAGEMLGLEWGRVHLAERYVTLPMTKNGDARDVPLSSRAAGLLERMQGLHRLHVFTVTSATLDALFRRARDKCGLSDLHFHDSRATAVTRLAQRLSIHDLARMIGHRDLKSLLVYYRKSASDIAAQLD